MPLPVPRPLLPARLLPAPSDGPVLAAVDDSPLAIPVVLQAAALAERDGVGLLVATVFTIRGDAADPRFPGDAPAVPRTPLELTVEAYAEAVATLERVRPALARLGVPYTTEVLGCSGRGRRRRQDRRIATQLLRLRVERRSGTLVLGLPSAGAHLSGVGVVARVLGGVPPGVLVAFGVPVRTSRAAG